MCVMEIYFVFIMWLTSDLAIWIVFIKFLPVAPGKSIIHLITLEVFCRHVMCLIYIYICLRLHCLFYCISLEHIYQLIWSCIVLFAALFINFMFRSNIFIDHRYMMWQLFFLCKQLCSFAHNNCVDKAVQTVYQMYTSITDLRHDSFDAQELVLRDIFCGL